MSASQAFNCRRCGHCCQGEGGIVCDARDQQRLAGHLGVSAAEFLGAFTREAGGKTLLRVGEDGFCVFFKDGCSVHPARPDICRAWPFFRGNLVDAVSFELAKDYCPGIEAAASHREFASQGAAYLRGHGLVKRGDAQAASALILTEAVLAGIEKDCEP